MKNVLRATLIGLITLVLCYLLLDVMGSLAHVPHRQLIPLPALEMPPNYGDPPFGNVHC